VDIELENESREIDLLEYWRVIVKRKWIAITFFCVVVLFMGIDAFTKIPMYRASASILVKENPLDSLSLNELLYDRYQSYDYMDKNLNTQLYLLRSKAMAERVAVRMNLSARPEWKNPIKQKTSPINFVKQVLSFRWISSLIPKKKSNPAASNTNPGSESRTQRQGDPNIRMAGVVLGGLSATPLENTKVVMLSYSSPYPVLAADIVNNVAQEFIDFSTDMRFEATQQTSDFLTEQINQLREELAEKEQELQKYGKEKEIILLNNRENTIVSAFSEFDSAYSQAQIDRINKEAYYRELRGLNVDSLPQFINNPLIQGLKTSYSNLKNDYDVKSKIYKPDYPEMIQIRTRLESMREELKSEINKAVDSAESEYQSALKRESSLKRSLDEQKANVLNMSSNAILYNSLKIEVDNKRMLLNTLTAKQNETMVSARLSGLKSSNIQIIDKAEVPGGPFSPNTQRSLMMAILFGLFGGVGLCFLLEYLDNTIKSQDEVEKISGLTSLGAVAYVPPEGLQKKGKYGYYSKYGYSEQDETQEKEKTRLVKQIELANYYSPRSVISEEYRTIRTSIMLSHADAPPKTIAITSALPREGKTSTCVNMAATFSQVDEKVLILDMDMQKPRIHQIFRLRNIKGVSNYLAGKVTLNEVIQKTGLKNVWAMTSGPIPSNPSELLNSKKARDLIEELKEIFGFILIDTPPVLAVVDPMIVSSYIDSVVFVIRSGKTAKKPFLKAVGELRKVNADILGVVFNEIKPRQEKYYYSGYSDYSYHHYGRSE
jgi:polysaccharide biosynthesis transport protein